MFNLCSYISCICIYFQDFFILLPLFYCIEKTYILKEQKMKRKVIHLCISVLILFIFTACGGGGSGKTFNDVEKVEDWLAKQKGGGSPDDPIPFSVKQNLQNMASPESNWQKLLTSIGTGLRRTTSALTRGARISAVAVSATSPARTTGIGFVPSGLFNNGACPPF
jgi:hypothetical protein